jgi:primosomal protein N' (replication factor Y) (superfamily II helicase)
MEDELNLPGEDRLPPVAVVRVLLDSALDRPLDYQLSQEQKELAAIGSRVRVPLQAREVLGTILSFPTDIHPGRLRPISTLLHEKPLIRPVLLRMAHWIADYYCCREEVALRTVLPQVIRRAEVGARQQQAVELVRAVSANEIEDLRRKAPRQAGLLEALQSTPAPMLLSQLEQVLPGCRDAVQGLQKRGLVRTFRQTVERDPHAGETFLPTNPLALNAEQAVALAAVETAMAAPKKPILLHGITGSGKTEVYLQAIAMALAAGRTAIVLVPEISLTPQTVERFKSRFADRQKEIAVLHSHLSEGERHDEWYKIHSGQARVVIGARSAIFAPLENLGLIVVDEEHENSYKQDEVPKYNARDLAVLRGTMEPCAVLLGSATPSLESYHNATTGKYELVDLRERADNRQLPLIRILDLRVMKRHKGAEALFAVPLIQAVNERLSRQEQVIIFLNRRGYSTSLICQACGHVCECPDCSVALTYHREAGRLVCHICGHSRRAPKKCPECEDPGIRFSGTGTQKVEEAVARCFPQARIARMDADAMSRKNAYQETLGKFRQREIDILVGTQMIAKGLHFPNVTLVGIVNADLGLHLPDFRAGERTFQLLTQVAGRAGRGEMEGEVMVQTYTPFAAAIQFARHHDFSGFVEQELDFRRQFSYPPFARMILLTVRSVREDLAEFTAQTLRRKLAEDLPEGIILGEAGAAPLSKAKGNFRFHIAMRAPRSIPLQAHIQRVLHRTPLPEDVFLAIDVDPQQLL